jgi:hypothetical protein
MGEFGSGVGECNGDPERALAIGGIIWFGIGDFGNGDEDCGTWNTCDAVALSSVFGWSLGVCRIDDILLETQLPTKQQSL